MIPQFAPGPAVAATANVFVVLLRRVLPVRGGRAGLITASSLQSNPLQADIRADGANWQLFQHICRMEVMRTAAGADEHQPAARGTTRRSKRASV
jgi:hypothetical protein